MAEMNNADYSPGINRSQSLPGVRYNVGMVPSDILASPIELQQPGYELTMYRPASYGVQSQITGNTAGWQEGGRSTTSNMVRVRRIIQYPLTFAQTAAPPAPSMEAFSRMCAEFETMKGSVADMQYVSAVIIFTVKLTALAV